MDRSPDDLLAAIRRTLNTWHAAYLDATFPEMGEAVEQQLHRLRTSLLAEQTEQTSVDAHALCRACGATMEPRIE